MKQVNLTIIQESFLIYEYLICFISNYNVKMPLLKMKIKKGNKYMFIRKKGLFYNAKSNKPDAVMARRLQELLGGQWGEMTGMTSYLF